MSWGLTVPATPRADFLGVAGDAIDACFESQGSLTAGEWRKLFRQMACTRSILLTQRDGIDGDYLAASISGHVGDFSSLSVSVYATTAPTPQPATEAAPAAAEGGEAA